MINTFSQHKASPYKDQLCVQKRVFSIPDNPVEVRTASVFYCRSPQTPLLLFLIKVCSIKYLVPLRISSHDLCLCICEVAGPGMFEVERLKGLLQVERNKSALLGATVSSLKQDKELLQQELTKKAELICEFLQDQLRPGKLCTLRITDTASLWLFLAW